MRRAARAPRVPGKLRQGQHDQPFVAQLLDASSVPSVLLVIPRGVWHAERNIGASDVVVVNFPTIPYDHASPDKYRLPLDTKELPVDLGPGWRGW